MKFSHRVGLKLFLLLVCICLSFSGVAFAQHKITANFLPFGPVCFIKGYVHDAADQPVHPANIVFDCGDGVKATSETLDASGMYMFNVPLCTGYTITASAPGKKPSSQTISGLAADAVETVPLTFEQQASLQDAVQCLQIAGGLPVPAPLPLDQDEDGALGLSDAIYNIQFAAGLRGGPAPLNTGFSRGAMEIGTNKKKVTVSKDTDGDGDDDWSEDHETDEYGYLELDTLVDGIYNIAAYSDLDGDGNFHENGEHAVRVQNVKFAGRNIHLKTVQMNLFGAISGNVTLGDGTDPMGIRVHIPGTSFEASPEADGDFTIANLPEGAYTIRAVKAGYGTVAVEDVAAETGKVTTMAAMVLPTLAGSASGTVTLSGQADSAGILVTLVSAAGQRHKKLTDAAGTALLTDIPAGDYDVVATKQGYQSYEGAIQVIPGQPAVFGPGVLAPETALGSIQGTITRDGVTDHSGIMVTVAGTGRLAVTDNAGSFVISDLPVGTYSVFMDADGYIAKKVDGVAVTAGTPAVVSDNLLRFNATSEAQTHGSIVGVAKYLDLAPHAGINVKVEGTSLDISTDTNGAFIIDSVKPGTYTLTFTQANYQTLTIPGVIVAPWGTTQVPDVTMIPRTGSIVGTVTLEASSDPGGVLVSVDGTSVQAVTDTATGSFLLQPLLPGTYTLRFVKVNSQYPAVTVPDVPVQAGETNTLATPIQLLLPPQAPTGTVATYIDNTTVKVTWNGSPSTDIAGYDVFFGPNQDEVTQKATTTLVVAQTGGEWAYTVTGLTAGSPYWFGVKAVDSDGLVSPLSVPGQPDALGSITGILKLEGEAEHSGVTVSADGTTVQTVTDANGSFTLSGLAAGTYTLRFQKDGYAVFTQAGVSVTAGNPTTIESGIELKSPPSPPTGTTAAYQNATEVKIVWNASLSNDVVGYDVYYAGAKDEVDKAGATKANTASITSRKDGIWTFTAPGLTAGTTYWFGVRAVDGDGLESLMSEPTQPLALGAISGQVFLEGLNFGSWGDVTISLTGTTFQTVSNDYGQFTLSNIPAGTYTVRAFKEDPFLPDEIAGFAVIPGQTATLSRPLNLKVPPQPPTNVSASQASGSSISVSWTASVSTDKAGYNVYYGTSSAAISTKANTTGLVTGTTFEVTGLGKGVQYFFAVQTVDNDSLSSVVAPSDGSLSLTLAPSHDATVISGGYIFNNPFDIELTTDGSKGYVTSRQNGVVLVIDFAAVPANVTGQIDLTGTDRSALALALSPDNSKLYVTANASSQGTLFEVLTATGAMTGRSINLGITPQAVVTSTDGAYVYVCTNNPDSVHIVDAATFTVSSSVSLNNLNVDPTGMAIANGKLYVAGYWGSKVFVIDVDPQSATFHTLIDAISVSGSPYAIAARADGRYVYVSHETPDGIVTVIDTATDAIATSVTIKKADETAWKNPKGMAVFGDILYVVNYSDNTVTMISTVSHTKLQLANNILSGGNGPENLVVSPDGSKLYIVHSFVGSVEILKY